CGHAGYDPPRLPGRNQEVSTQVIGSEGIMHQTIDRRTFLRAAGVTAAGAALFGTGYHVAPAADAGKGAPNADKLGWRLGCQAYTFRSGSFFEAIDKTAQLGLHWIEAYPGQRQAKLGGL